MKHCQYKSRTRVKFTYSKNCEQSLVQLKESYRCLCLCGECANVPRRRSSSPAAYAWWRQQAWGRCSGAAGGSHAGPSLTQPAHRPRPSWSVCSPPQKPADRMEICQSIVHMAEHWSEICVCVCVCKGRV